MALRIWITLGTHLDPSDCPPPPLAPGDKGQSEEFSGPTLDVGECALPAPDYYENECKHGYGHHPTTLPPDYSRPAPACVPFHGIAIPNRYECSSAPPVVTDCDSICHNHGASCGAGTSACGTVDDAATCAETCSWQSCGGDSARRGPSGPGCPTGCGQPADQTTHPSTPHSTRRVLFGAPHTHPACPLECTGDYSQHHDDPTSEPSVPDSSAGGCSVAACLTDPPASYCASIPGC